MSNTEATANTARRAASNSAASVASLINDVMDTSNKAQGKEASLVVAMFAAEATFSHDALRKLWGAKDADRTAAIEKLCLADVERYQRLIRQRDRNLKEISSPDAREQAGLDAKEARAEIQATLQMVRRALTAVFFLRHPKSHVVSFEVKRGTTRFTVLVQAVDANGKVVQKAGRDMVKDVTMSLAEITKLGAPLVTEVSGTKGTKRGGNQKGKEAPKAAPINSDAAAVSALQGAATVLKSAPITDKPPEVQKAWQRDLATLIAEYLGHGASRSIAMNEAREFFISIGFNVTTKDAAASQPQPAKKSEKAA